MRVAVYRGTTTVSVSGPVQANSTVKLTDPGTSATRDVEVPDVEYVNMANGWIMASLGWAIWAFIAGLNVYLIVMLGLGRS